MDISRFIGFITNTLMVLLLGSAAVTLGYYDFQSLYIVIEMFTIIIAFSAFVIVINTYNISQNNYLTFLGIAFGFAAVLEGIHLLTHTNPSFILWGSYSLNLLTAVLPKLLQSLSILISFLFLKRRLNISLSITLYSILTVFLCSLLFIFGDSWSLAMDRLGGALVFKALELLLAISFTAALAMLIYRRKGVKSRLYKYMFLYLLISLVQSLLFGVIGNERQEVNIAAVILEFAAFFCLYRAVIQNTLKNPVDSIFYELDKVTSELADKNREVSKSNEKLRHDLDDLHLVERLLRKSKAWSRSIFEGSPIGIALLNLGGVVIEANPALERILGYSGAELRNVGISNITHIDDIESDSRLFDDLVDGTVESYQLEKRYIRKDEKVIWANVKMSYIQNVGEDFQFIIAMIEDITQQKENDEKQKQLVARLEATNNELDNFAYIVSHDLKAPLRGIGSLANWLVTDYRDKLDQEGAEIIDLLINRVERMKNFIEGILQYSRVNRIKENEVDVDVNRVIRDVLELISPPENIEISIKSELPVIRGERIRIEQIFQNLLSNAIKFMDKPKGKIVISSRDGEEYWEFKIEDNGAGIDEKYFSKIFMIFQTLQPRDKFESTGVGLSIVKKIVETSGGKIWLDSEVEKGTTFYFTLPKNAQ